MREKFKKYFTPLIFILLSGFLLLHANTTIGSTLHSLQSANCESQDSFAVQAHFSPISSSFNANLRRVLIEDTEFEDLDHSADNDNLNPDFFDHSISFLFHFMGWDHTLKSQDDTIAYQTPSLQHCKNYIRFEVFRI
ncbi:MAG TPA: hypothetical protein ENH91_06505 [Leeuwenhoekiella sp.]|nr:hypothetical protein [Leeuwenhoekiella sp.]